VFINISFQISRAAVNGWLPRFGQVLDDPRRAEGEKKK
jgi:hypothetical protein